MSERYDAVVIGAGQSGGPLASALAGTGQRVALVERDKVGGTCINTGCTPTKTMVASARVAHLARRAADYGVQVGPVHMEQTTVRDRKRAIVDMFRSGSEKGIESSEGVDLIRGEASFSGRGDDGFTLAVARQDGGELTLRAGQVFIDTGARPALPDLPGLSDVPYLNSTSIMELAETPEHLIVVGGGYIGVEFAQMFRRFGSRVTMVQHSGQLLGREDRDIAENILEILREDGLDVLLETHPQSVQRRDGDGVALMVKTPEGERTIEGSHLLMATGRTPNSDRLNLPAVGVETDARGHIQVNDRLETNVPGIYAMGDVKGGPAFTHISYDDFRVLRTNLIDGGSASIRQRLVPYTVFMDPQLGRVGLGEAAARSQGYNVRVAKLPMTSVARAIEVDETRGMMKAVVDADTEQILGCAILGIEGGEIAAVIQVAMMGKLPYTALRDGVFSHPTLAESLNNLFATLEG